MGGRGGSGRSVAAPAAASSSEPGNSTGFDTGDQELNEILDVFYDTPGYMIGVFNGQSVINYEPRPGLPRDSGDVITFRDAREGLARKYGWGHAKQDAAFHRLSRSGQISIQPLSKRLSLTQPMRDAGMFIGGQEKEGFYLRDARSYRRSR